MTVSRPRRNRLTAHSPAPPFHFPALLFSPVCRLGLTAAFLYGYFAHLDCEEQRR